MLGFMNDGILSGKCFRYAQSTNEYDCLRRFCSLGVWIVPILFSALCLSLFLNWMLVFCCSVFVVK